MRYSTEKPVFALDGDKTAWGGDIWSYMIGRAAAAGAIPRIPRTPGEDIGSGPAALRNLSQTLEGVPTDAFRPFYYDAAWEVYKGTYTFTRPLMRAAVKAGYEITLVTDAPQEFGKVVAHALGNVSRVIGSRLLHKGGTFTGKVDLADDKMDVLGAPPDIAMGDSARDYGMLMAAQRALVVGIDSYDPESVHFRLHEEGVTHIPIIGQGFDGTVEQCEETFTPTGHGCALKVIQASDVPYLVGLEPV